MSMSSEIWDGVWTGLMYLECDFRVDEVENNGLCSAGRKLFVMFRLMFQNSFFYLTLLCYVCNLV